MFKCWLEFGDEGGKDWENFEVKMRRNEGRTVAGKFPATIGFRQQLLAVTATAMHRGGKPRHLG